MLKKIFAIIFSVLMLLSFSACGNKDTAKNNTGAPAAEEASGVEAAPGSGGNLDGEVAVENSADAEPEAFADGEAAAYHTPAPNATAAPVATPVPTKAPAPEEDADSEAEGDYQPSVGLTEYERYNAMSGEEQQAFMESFGSVEAFVAWYNSAREAYESGRIEIDGSEINAGDLVG